MAKILLIHIFFTKNSQSGVNPIVFETYDKLKAQGHNVYIFSLNRKPYYDENYEYSKYFVNSSFRNKDNPNLFDKIKYFLNTIYNFESEQKLKKLLDEIKPDIVHIHSMWELSFSIIKPIKKRNIPIIYTAHDISLFCPAAFFVGVNYCNKCKGINIFPCLIKKCIKGSLFKSIIFYIKAFIERLLGAYNLDYYLTVSEATKNYIIEMGIPKNKIEVLSNFISDDLYKMAVPDYTKKGNYFLYAGGDSEVKGIFTLLNAFKKLSENIELHISGGGDYNLVKKFIEQNNLSNVKILGSLTKEEMQKEYQNCISVIMPSEWFETFGMINIEAAVLGKPSIASNIGGLPDVVENNKTGLIFEPGNVEQLKQSILLYWNNPDIAAEHGKNAYEKVKTNYSEEKYFKKLLNVYESVINNAK